MPGFIVFPFMQLYVSIFLYGSCEIPDFIIYRYSQNLPGQTVAKRFGNSETGYSLFKFSNRLIRKCNIDHIYIYFSERKFSKKWADYTLCNVLIGKTVQCRLNTKGLQ